MTDTVAEPLVAPPQVTARLPLQFRGTAGEYFRIWIVNLLLTVATLGIYSAWAKVRTHRYLYGSTWLDGRSFEYTARPLAILKGRLIAVVLFGGWYVAVNFAPLVALVVAPLVLIALPWIIMRSLRFRAYHTRYRNLRFRFAGTYPRAAFTFLAWPLLAVLTFGLLWPFFAFHRIRYVYGELGYGGTRFRFDGPVGPVYAIYVKLGAMLLGGALLLAVGVPVLAELGAAAGVPLLGVEDESQSGGLVTFILLLYIPLLLLYVFPPAYLKARMGNYAVNALLVGPHALHSAMRARDVYWIYLTNLVAIVFTVGLAIPWAVVRMARYRAQHTAVQARGDLRDMPPGRQDRVGAAGEEIGEMFDLDIGF